jgi:nitrate/nitrite-specific signal transduction histidine kinase
MPALAERIAAPRISMERRQVEVSKRGPHGTTILVLRSLENDMSGLHRFGFQIAAMAVATLAIGLLGGWWISGRMVEPIQMISHTASQISATSLNRRIETAHLDQELVQLGSVLNGTFARLEQAFSHRRNSRCPDLEALKRTRKRWRSV